MSKNGSRHRVLQPASKLHLMVERPGGIARSVAVVEADRRVEAQRGPALKAIKLLVDELEMKASGQSALTRDALGEIRRTADQIVSHATTYDLESIARAGKALCDLAGVFNKLGHVQMEPIFVHVRALRLFISREKIPDHVSEAVLGELQKVRTHLDAKLEVPNVRT